MYAIVQTAGKQIRVSPDQIFKLNEIVGEAGAEIVMDKVLAISDGDKTVFGTPFIEGAQVKAEVVETGKSAKVLVYKHVPKKAHEKLTGHRQSYTRLKVTEIRGG